MTLMYLLYSLSYFENILEQNTVYSGYNIFRQKENCTIGRVLCSHFKNLETGTKLRKSHGEAVVKPRNFYLV